MQRGRSRFRGGGRGGGRGDQQKGLFANKIWHCDCQPRLPAEHFRVKKDGKNHGRWFYTCQQQEPKRCGFFLWDEDAKSREAAAVMSNRTSEPQQNRNEDQDGWNAGRSAVPGKGLFSNAAIKQERDTTPTPTPSPSGTLQSGSKRSLDSTGFDESDDDWGLDDGNCDDLLRAADSFETPQAHKVQKTGVYATPATAKRSPRKLPWLEQTASPPSVNTASEHLVTPSRPPVEAPEANAFTPIAYPELPNSLKTIQSPDSPSPQARFKDALVNPADSASSLTSEVLASLASIYVPPDKLSNLRTILSRHDLRAQGVAKGRDISRLALKAKEATIVELQSKIVRL